MLRQVLVASRMTMRGRVVGNLGRIASLPQRTCAARRVLDNRVGCRSLASSTDATAAEGSASDVNDGASWPPSSQTITPVKTGVMYTRDDFLTFFHQRLIPTNKAARLVNRVAECSNIFSQRDFEVMINGLCHMADNWKSVLQLLQIAEESGTPPTSVMLDRAMRVCAMAKRDTVVRSLWSRVKALQLQPTERMYQALIRSYSNSQLWPQALDCFRELQQTSPDDVPQSNRNLTYRLVLHACAQADEWEMALNLLDDIEIDIIASEDFGTDDERLTLFNIVIDACVRNNRLQEAKSILPRIANAQLKPQAVTMNTILKGCEPGNAADAFAWLCGMGIEPNIRTFNVLIEKEGQSGRWQRALQWFVHMQNLGMQPNNVSYGKLAYAFGMNNQWRLAVDTLDNMFEAGLEPDLVVLGHVMRACQKARQFALVLKVYEQIVDKAGLTPNIRTINLALHACRYVNREELADVMSLSFAEDDTTKKMPPTGHLEWGLRILQDTERLNLEPDSYTYVSAFSLFAHFGAMAIEPGMALLQSAYEREFIPSPEFCRSALLFCLKAGAFPRALSFQLYALETNGEEWFEKNFNDFARMPIFHAVAQNRPTEIVAQLEFLAEHVPNATMRDDATWQMMREHPACNSPTGPWHTVRQMLVQHDPAGTHLDTRADGSIVFRNHRQRKSERSSPQKGKPGVSGKRRPSTQRRKKGVIVVVQGVPPKFSSSGLRKAFDDFLNVRGIQTIKNYDGVAVMSVENAAVADDIREKIYFAQRRKNADKGMPEFVRNLKVEKN